MKKALTIVIIVAIAIALWLVLSGCSAPGRVLLKPVGAPADHLSGSFLADKQEWVQPDWAYFGGAYAKDFVNPYDEMRENTQWRAWRSAQIRFLKEYAR